MRTTFAAIGLASLLAISAPAAADTLNLRSAETRLTLGYRVSDAAVQALLPPGWSVANPGGEGPNLSVTLTDRMLYEDAKGEPVAGGRTRDVIFTAGAVNSATRETRTFVILTLSPQRATPGPYGVSIPAIFETRSAIQTGADDIPKVDQHWAVKLSEGGSLDFDVRYDRARVRRAAANPNGIRVYSAKTPDFYRIYKTDSGTDSISTLNGGRIQAFSLKASGPRLTSLFDGKERLISVSETPFYLREVWLP